MRYLIASYNLRENGKEVNAFVSIDPAGFSTVILEPVNCHPYFYKSVPSFDLGKKWINENLRWEKNFQLKEAIEDARGE